MNAYSAPDVCSMGLAAECRHAVPRVSEELIPCSPLAPDRNVPDKDLGGGDGDRARACAAVWGRPSLVLAMLTYYLPKATLKRQTKPKSIFEHANWAIQQGTLCQFLLRDDTSPPAPAHRSLKLSSK
jgi:hypothetical protein